MADIKPTRTHELTVTERQAQRRDTNPAMAYLMTLGSDTSRTKTASHLRQIIRLLQGLPNQAVVSIEHFNWTGIDYLEMKALVEVMKKRRYSPESIKAFMAAVRGTLNEAFVLGQIQGDQLERVRRVKPPRGRRVQKGQLLTSKEYQALLSACDDTAKGRRDRAIIALLFRCGLRRAEVVGIDLDDYRKDERDILIRGKGARERWAFLDTSAAALVNEWIERYRGHEPGPLFVRVSRGGNLARISENNRLTDQAVYTIIDARQKAAGIRKLSPHDLRRSLASTLLNKGMPIEDVRDVLGHSSVTTTERYDVRQKDRLKHKVRYFLNETDP
jgi:site-specific recombinase XerD